MTSLLAGSGGSTHADPTAAGREAAQAAIAQLHGQDPALVLVYASVRYDLAALVAGVREVTGAAPLAGASSSGHFHSGQLTPPGEGVAVLALTSGDYRFGVASAGGLAQEPFEVGRALARSARAAAGPEPSAHAAVILFSDALAGDPQQLINGIYRVTGAGVPVVGGAAGDDRRLQQTWVLHDDEVLTDAAVAVWVASPHALTVGCGHGWEAISPPMMVTESAGTRVEKIAGRPAVDVFREYVQPDEQTGDGARDGGWHAAHAFGLIEPDGTELIRGAYIDGDDRLNTFNPLPEYAAVRIVSAGPDTLLDIVEPVVAQAVGDGAPGALLVFSCVARLDILGDRGGEECTRIQASAGDPATFGFFTYGEFARSGGVAGVHNATLTAIAL